MAFLRVIELGLVHYGLGFLISLASSFYVAEPQMAITEEQLTVGSEFYAIYEQRFKRNVKVRGFRMQLVRNELVSYEREGDDETIRMHRSTNNIIQAHDRDGWQARGGDIFKQRFFFLVPEEAVRAINPANKKAESWFIRVQMDFGTMISFKRRYATRVETTLL